MDVCNLFLEHAPRFHCLSFDCSRLPISNLKWKWPNVTKITSLELHGRTKTLYDSDFFKALHEMSSLARLVIADTRHDPSQDTPLSCGYCHTGTREDFVDLKNLQTFSVTATVEFLAHSLRHIRAPLHSRSTFHLIVERWTDIDPSSYDALSQSLNSFCDFLSPTSPLQSAYVLFLDDPHHVAFVHLGLSRTAQPLYPSPTDSIGSNNLTLTKLVGDQLPRILASIPTKDVRALITQSIGYSRNFRHLSFFPNVETLVLKPEDVSLHGVRLLQNIRLLPRLRRIDLGIPEFTLYAISYLSLDVTCGIVTWCIAIGDVLTARRASGRPLEVIYLHVADEVAPIEAERIEETSCKGLRTEIVLESVRRLRTLNGIEIVSADFDVFAM